MKTFALVITALALTSCSISGTYNSASQNFDFNGSIIIPVEEIKK